MRRHQGLPISEGRGTGEIVSRNEIDNNNDINDDDDDICDNTFDDIDADFHYASYIFNHANDTLDDGRDDKKNFSPVPGSLEGGKHLLLCGDDEQQPCGQAAVGVQL